jgi:hypothetical protein
MSIGGNKSKSALGENPLTLGIFSKTNEAKEIQENKLQERRINKEEYSFLKESEREKVNLRIPIELNDWLDELVKKGKRAHGQKIPKEVWLQAALELLRGIDKEWEKVGSQDELREKIKTLHSRIKNKE